MHNSGAKSESVDNSLRDTDKTIGLIGLGLLGSAVADRLRKAERSVIGFDVETNRVLEFENAGGRRANSVREIFQQASTIILCLPTSEITQKVLADPALSLTNRLIIDMTTGDPEQMEQIARELNDRSARYVDATIAGSSAQVRTGEAIAMIGGTNDAFAQCEPVLNAIVAELFHTGPCGSGARMKLVVNLALGLHRAVLAETLCFADRTGVDPHRALAVLRASPAFSRVMETKGDKMLSGDFTPQARLAQHLKDVRLILAAGQRTKARLPLTTRHEQLLNELVESGAGELDNSAIIRAFQRGDSPDLVSRCD